MKKEFKEYFKSIGITSQEYLKRIETLMEIHSELCQDEIVDIFVDEYIKEDGTREYEDISFYSKQYFFGVSQFLTTDTFILSKNTKDVKSIKIKKKDYDFKKATEKSRLNIDVSYETSTPLHGSFKASKENCDILKQIFLKYMMPNIIE